MRKMLIIIFPILILTIVSCTVENYDFNFVNNSDYDIYIEPDGQDWTSFYLYNHSSKTITISDSNIYFIYDHAGLVNCDTSLPDSIVFYNKTLLTIYNNSSVNLELVSWNGYYFGNDLIWDSDMGTYIHGLKSGSADIKEVNWGCDYIYFYLVNDYTQYRTTDLVCLTTYDQIIFTFTDFTTTKSINKNNIYFNINNAVPVPDSDKNNLLKKMENTKTIKNLGQNVKAKGMKTLNQDKLSSE